MIEEIINGINYRLNEETLTAEVAEKSGGYEGTASVNWYISPLKKGLTTFFSANCYIVPKKWKKANWLR